MRTLAIALLTLAFASFALADDFMPPDWRGDPLTVMAEWDFGADFTGDPNNIDADAVDTVGDGIHEFNDAYIHAHAGPSVHWGADPDDPDDGVAHTDEVPGQLDFFLGNWFDQYEFKHIWVQITYGGQGVPMVSDVVAPNPETDDWTDPVHGERQDTVEVDANHRVEYWLLMPNPNREHVYVDLPPYSYVDQIVIDTISTNDPIATEARSWSGVKSLFD